MSCTETEFLKVNTNHYTTCDKSKLQLVAQLLPSEQLQLFFYFLLIVSDRGGFE